MISTSTMRGTPASTWRPGASRHAAISLSAEFLAPPARTVPCSGPPGRTTKTVHRARRDGQTTGFSAQRPKTEARAPDDLAHRGVGSHGVEDGGHRGCTSAPPASAATAGQRRVDGGLVAALAHRGQALRWASSTSGPICSVGGAGSSFPSVKAFTPDHDAPARRPPCAGTRRRRRRSRPGTSSSSMPWRTPSSIEPSPHSSRRAKIASAWRSISSVSDSTNHEPPSGSATFVDARSRGR